jgi:hypothetical protein
MVERFHAPVFTEDSLENPYKNSHRAYTLTYQAASQNQTLRIQFTDNGLYDRTFGNVNLHSRRWIQRSRWLF